MPLFTSRVTPLILDELARGERRVLSLVVAVGRVLERSDTAVKGNLTNTIKSALRALVAAKVIVDADGMYSLARRSNPVARTPGPQPRPRPDAQQIGHLVRERQSREDRNKAATRRNALKVEQYLTEIERAQGCATAWALRERLEHGHVTLEELRGR